MSNDEKSPKRGRPKTLPRGEVLHIAMMTCWADGPMVAVNEICENAGVSKPGIYREFGSVDGLHVAILESYATLVLNPLHEIHENETAFDVTLDALIEFTVQERGPLGVPDGCLFTAMRSRVNELGARAQNKVRDLEALTLSKYERWLNRGKERGEFRSEVPTGTIAIYFDAQNINAMRLQKQGTSNAVIREILNIAFSSFRP